MKELGSYYIIHNKQDHHLTKRGFDKVVLANSGEESFDFMKWAWSTFGPGMTLNQFYTSDSDLPPKDVKWIVDNSDFYIHNSIVDYVIISWA